MTAVSVTPEAFEDIQSAAAWYDERRRSLGNVVIGAIGNAFDRIRENPLQFPTVQGHVRRVLVRRFPYAAYFIVEKTDAVVLAVLHLHRDLAVLEGRSTR